ncbi:glycerate kinase family protein [Virgibacillus necropolis]|uniref:Glycerate kinase n=1 Tax=Virgibacillus necropolis TaxID=163877 RepID=A0A221MGV4_9BACI|nr:glycerate kinase [Virgibacillus necropolis]ASN06893.1 glycerate kinase [Virgibacillus necropolis]
MKVVMIPSGFKECLDAEEVAYSMMKGARRFDPFIKTEMIPMIDGGEGFAKAIIKIKNGELIYKDVIGPVGEKVKSHYGIFIEGNKRTAVIEMAAVAGLKLVPSFQRNPLKTTTYGVGELIIDALDMDVDKIMIGCGDSGTSDGGAGMAQALGVQFLDDEKQVIPIMGGEDLLKASSIDTTHIDKRLCGIPIDVACNWTNVLCGKQGVARVFGPQKGAKPEEVETLSLALEHYAMLIEQSTKKNVRNSPGSGASGGLGAGLLAFADATLHRRFDLIMNYIQIEEKIATADLVITAEGSLDFQTPNGKIPCEVARIAKKNNIPVIAITGTIGRGAELNYDVGIDAYSSIIQRPVTLKKAMFKAPQWIEESVEGILRHIGVGIIMADRKTLSERELSYDNKINQA